MRRRASSGCNCMSKPQMRAAPEVGFIRPASILSVVVLPAAFGPSMAKNSPRGMVSEISLTAVMSPNFLTRLTSSIMRWPSRFGPFVECGDEVVGQLDAKDFTERAYVNDNGITQHVGFQTINGNRLAADLQAIAVRLPLQVLCEGGRLLLHERQIQRIEQAVAEAGAERAQQSAGAGQVGEGEVALADAFVVGDFDMDRLVGREGMNLHRRIVRG